MGDVGEVVEVGVGHAGVHAGYELDAPVPHVAQNLESARGVAHRAGGGRAVSPSDVVQPAEREGRVDVQPLFGDHVGVVRVVVVHVAFVFGEPGAVDEVVDAGVHAVSDARRRVAVGGDAQSEPLGVLNRRAQGLRRILRGADVRPRREAAAGGHYLDAVRAQLELVADGGDDLLGGVRLRAEHVAVAAGGGYGRSGGDDSRAGDDALRDGGFDGHDDLVSAAQVAHGGDARSERGANRPDAAHDERLVALGHYVGVGVRLGAAVDVGVHLDEARHERAAGDVYHLGVLALGEAQFVLGGHFGDAPVFHDDRPVLHRRRAGAVYQSACLQDELHLIAPSMRGAAPRALSLFSPVAVRIAAPDGSQSISGWVRGQAGVRGLGRIWAARLRLEARASSP